MNTICPMQLFYVKLYLRKKLKLEKVKNVAIKHETWSTMLSMLLSGFEIFALRFHDIGHIDPYWN